MQLVETVKKPCKRLKDRKWPTVGEMLDYIKKNKIPRDAEILVEHVNDSYLNCHGWGYYEVKDPRFDWPSIMLPAHNGFGSIDGKKYFAIWMHY